MPLSIPKIIIIFMVLILMSGLAIAGELEEGFVAYRQGDNELAYNKWLPLAIKGDVRAQFFLSVILENRTGSLEDKDNAKKWLTASANNGFVPARFNLGNNYHKGKYGPVNNKMAEYWWNQAAVQGFAEAQYHLATLYYWGKRGVKLDLKEAFYWFEQAAKNGYKDAADAVLLIRAGEPLQPLAESGPANIAYDDPRIVSKLSLDSKQMVTVEEQKKQIAAAPAPKSLPATSAKKPEPNERPAIYKQDIHGQAMDSAASVSEEIDINIKAVTPERSDKDWVSQQPVANYTIQLFASTSLNECKNHIRQLFQDYQLVTHVQSFMKNSRKYCAVVYGSYSSYSQAKTRLSQLPRKMQQAKPWLRKMDR